MLRCDDCGRFCKSGTWAEIYDRVGMQLDRVHYRCPRCTEARGPVKSNATPHDGNMGHYQGRFETPNASADA